MEIAQNGKYTKSKIPKIKIPELQNTKNRKLPKQEIIKITKITND